jgi:predicted  nucleic acid-binding Zn-ribbon protein
LEAILKDRESETYQFVIKTVRDDGEQSIADLSERLIDLTDRLRDEALQTALLVAQLSVLQQKYDEELQELGHLRHQMAKVKRVLPMGFIRLTRRIFRRKSM